MSRRVRLGLLVLASLGLAALAAAGLCPGRIEPWSSLYRADADALAKRICALGDRKLCAETTALVADIRALSLRLQAAPCPAPGLAELDKLSRRYGELDDRLHDLHFGRLMKLTPQLRADDINGELVYMRPYLMTLAEATLRPRLDQQDKDLDVLEKRTAAAESTFVLDEKLRRAKVLGEAGAMIFARLKEQSLSISYLGDPTDKRDTRIAPLRARANGIARRLAALQTRLQGIETSLSQPPSPFFDFSGIGLTGDLAVPRQLLGGKMTSKRLKTMGSTNPFGLSPLASDQEAVDLFGPRQLDPVKVKKELRETSKPTLYKSPKTVQADAREDAPEWEPEFSAYQRLRRRAGRNQTAGDPAGRAKLAYKQGANDTCAIAAQVQILIHYKVFPAGDPYAVERRLKEEARSKGLFKDGTAQAFNGDLLLLHGLAITKHAKAGDEELLRAARQGKMLIVSMDAGLLWDMPEHVGSGHAVLVTGAELSRDGRKAYGYYINDSGNIARGRGRFIPIDLFLEAWHKRGSLFIEVQ